MVASEEGGSSFLVKGHREYLIKERRAAEEKLRKELTPDENCYAVATSESGCRIEILKKGKARPYTSRPTLTAARRKLKSR
jgi:hypothetical protein